MSSIQEKELAILAFWNKDKTFEKSLKGKKKQYVFYDGPPFATGLPHYGHLLASTIKDAVPRFWTMKGYRVDRVWGWDCHGLPIESIAERELKLKNKKEIEMMGVEKFCEYCRSIVTRYAAEWKHTIERLGRWVEFDNSYKTMDVDYMESVWWAFKEIWKKGLVYEGKRILMYCPHCETPLANAEIAMDNSYKDITESSVTVAFKVKNRDEYFLAWTTTPWTLIGNVALAVKEDAEYVRVLQDGKRYILAKERVSELTGAYEIEESFTGKELEGTEYEPLYEVSHEKRGYYVISDKDGVTTTDGTGIVHMAVYGEFDYEMIKKYDLPVIEHVGTDGTLKAGPEEFIGLWFKDADKKVLKNIEARGLAYKVKQHRHSYPFCYRCATPLFYAPLPSWFIAIQKVKKDMLAQNEKMNWYPAHLKDGRFKNNILNAPDWNISRNRYWASVIPVWKCDCGEMKVIGSIEELKKHAVSLPKELDLHKDVMDSVYLKCDCGKEMKRVPEVLDCWLESGAMSFAQVHYPFEKKEWMKKNFPGDFVAEYIAQTRTWFYYSLVMSTILFKSPPYLNVSTTGTILAEDGEKMSKSKDNFPDPNIVIEKYGADALRFYLLSSPVMEGDDIRFSERSVEEVYKKVLLILYNAVNFYEVNAAGPLAKKHSTNVLDVWIESRLEEVKVIVTEAMENYSTVKATRELSKFIDDLSTWYIRRSRERFNGEEASIARTTLKYVLVECAKIIAPFMPFAAEYVYRTVEGTNESVHLQAWPKVDRKKIKTASTKKMENARTVVSLALKERDRKGIPVRQVLQKVEVSGYELDNTLKAIVAEEVNVKEVVVLKAKELKITLDTVLTPELEAEGLAREVIRRVQAERKNRGLEKKDVISLKLALSEEVKISLAPHLETIKNKTGSQTLEFISEGSTDVQFIVKDKTIGLDF